MGSQRIPPNSVIEQRHELVDTVWANTEGFSSRRPGTWVDANGQDPEVGWGWSRDGAGMGTEPTKEGMGRSPLLQAGTINRFAPVVQNPCVHRGVTRPLSHCRVLGLQRALHSWRPLWVLSGDRGPSAETSHGVTTELQAQSSLLQALPPRSSAGRRERGWRAVLGWP